MKILSVKLDNDTVKNLKNKSDMSGKSPETVLADVVSRYIHYSGWQQDLLELSLESAEHGDFAGAEEIASTFTRWGVETKDAPPQTVWSGLGLRALRKELEHLGKSGTQPCIELAKSVWNKAISDGLEKRAFPGMTAGTLEVQLEGTDYCMAFCDKDGKRLIIGIVTNM